MHDKILRLMAKTVAPVDSHILAEKLGGLPESHSVWLTHLRRLRLIVEVGRKPVAHGRPRRLYRVTVIGYAVLAGLAAEGE